MRSSSSGLHDMWQAAPIYALGCFPCTTGFWFTAWVDTFATKWLRKDAHMNDTRVSRTYRATELNKSLGTMSCLVIYLTRHKLSMRGKAWEGGGSSN